MSAVSACAPAGDRTESRNFLRARCELNGNGRDCRILNLTSDGVFVESYVPAVTGSRVTLSFRLPNGYQVCTAGVVSDHRFQVGFSVEFVDLPAHDSDQINGIVG
jgi:PilZ domain-containing protein